jgi:hypothetical protein
MHMLAVRTRLLITEEDLQPGDFGLAHIIHDSVLVDVPLVALNDAALNDQFPGIDLEWLVRARGVPCPSCERTNCLMGRAERQRTARFRRSAKNVMFDMRNIPNDVHLDIETADLGLSWHKPMKFTHFVE